MAYAHFFLIRPLETATIAKASTRGQAEHLPIHYTHRHPTTGDEAGAYSGSFETGYFSDYWNSSTITLPQSYQTLQDVSDHQCQPKEPSGELQEPIDSGCLLASKRLDRGLTTFPSICECSPERVKFP